MTTQEDYEERLTNIEVTRIGEPTMKSFEALRKELQAIARKLKTTIYPSGMTYGFMVLICEEEEYAKYIGDETFNFQDPVLPEEYSAAISESMTEVQRRAKEEELRRYQTEYNKYMATIGALRAAIASAVDAEYIEKLKHPIVEYDMCTPYDMLKHIKDQIPLTTEERATLKAGIYLKWDGTTSLRSFINDMENGMKDASFWGVQVQPADAVDHLVEQIYANDPFESKVMTDWETRPTNKKTWERCIQYFLVEADKTKIHKKATAKQAGYHSANNVQEEADDAAEQDEQVNMVLEAMESGREQMNAVAATNTKLEATIA
jgi:hypothetical protein